jgi:uncharacterized protein (UPF0210 family)
LQEEGIPRGFAVARYSKESLVSYLARLVRGRGTTQRSVDVSLAVPTSEHLPSEKEKDGNGRRTKVGYKIYTRSSSEYPTSQGIHVENGVTVFSKRVPVSQQRIRAGSATPEDAQYGVSLARTLGGKK